MMMKRIICLNPTADALTDEGKLKHPLQPRISQEQTAIFATIDCKGAHSAQLGLVALSGIKHPEIGAAVSLMICSWSVRII